MGRRGISVREEGRWVFNRLAAAYGQRPAYPEELVARLASLAGGAGARVADLGAGTGHLTLPLARLGLRVCAVEPAGAMLDELARAARAAGLVVEAVHAAAEQTGLSGGGFDLALLADALHWVDPELAGLEIRRLLRAGGICAVVEARLCSTPFLDELQALLLRANPKVRPPSASPVEQLLSLATGSQEKKVERFLQEKVLDERAFEGTLRSLSHVGPALGSAKLDELLADARELARVHGGAMWKRELTLSWAQAR